MKPHRFKPLKSGDTWCGEPDENGRYCAAAAGHPIHKHAPMSPEQEADLEMIKTRFALRAEDKYRAGAAEHGGNVWDNVSLDEIEDELIDAYIYLQAWRRKLAAIKERVKQISLDEVLER